MGFRYLHKSYGIFGYAGIINVFHGVDIIDFGDPLKKISRHVGNFQRAGSLIMVIIHSRAVKSWVVTVRHLVGNHAIFRTF